VASLARPGGNVTGLSSQATDTAGKRLGLLREVVPGLRRLAIMANAESPVNKLEVEEVRTAARVLSLETETHNVWRAEDIVPALEGLKGRADALHICFDPLLSSNAVRINTLAIEARLPTTAGLRELVERGSLMSYAANFPEQWRSAAGYVDRILRGAMPRDMPVAQPTKFDLVINLKTAKAIGIEVAPTLLARADEVIE
jgi:putative tryptophan/tyrosine transport system substrate-binding protein